MKTNHEKSVEPLHMLPRFDSQAILSEPDQERLSKSHSIYHHHSLSFEHLPLHHTVHETSFDPSLYRSQSVSHSQLRSSLSLPRFHSSHKRHYYDENQSADVATKIISEAKVNLSEVQEKSYRPNQSDIKFLERTYDRSGKKCWPAINTNIGKFDLEYAYEIIGDTLESYIRYRKLNRCQALSNFIEYRNKVYKREKIAQYASSPKTTAKMKDTPTKQTIRVPTKIVKLEEKPSSPVPPSPSAISEIIPSPFIVSSSPSVTSGTSSNLSPQISKEAFIPIPSIELLQRSSPKSVQRPTTPKQTNLNVPKKTSGTIKQIKTKLPSASSVKGSSQPKANVPFQSKTVPKKPLTKTANRKNKTCIIL